MFGFDISLSTKSTWCHDPHELPYYDYKVITQFVAAGLFLPVVVLIGVTCNILILVVMSRKKMRTSTNVFLCARAISDMIIILNEFQYFIATAIMQSKPQVGLDYLSHVASFGWYVSNHVLVISSWITVAVAVERYILVCYPIRGRGVITPKRAKIICAASFVVVIVLSLPYAIFPRYMQIECIDKVTMVSRYDIGSHEIWQEPGNMILLTVFMNIFKFVIPLLLLVILAIRITCVVQRSRRPSLKASKGKITKMLILVILVFISCLAPEAVCSFLLLDTNLPLNLIYGTKEFFDVFVCSTCIFNFFIYFKLNKKFKKEVIDMWSRFTRRLRCIMTVESHAAPTQSGKDNTPESKTEESHAAPTQTGQDEATVRQSAESHATPTQAGKFKITVRKTMESHAAPTKSGRDNTPESKTVESHATPTQSGKFKTTVRKTMDSHAAPTTSGKDNTPESKTMESHAAPTQSGKDNIPESKKVESHAAPKKSGKDKKKVRKRAGSHEAPTKSGKHKSEVRKKAGSHATPTQSGKDDTPESKTAGSHEAPTKFGKHKTTVTKTAGSDAAPTKSKKNNTKETTDPKKTDQVFISAIPGDNESKLRPELKRSNWSPRKNSVAGRSAENQ